MPFAKISGGRLHYEFEGDTENQFWCSPTHSAWIFSMWQRQVAAHRPNLGSCGMTVAARAAPLSPPAPTASNCCAMCLR